MTTLTLIPRLPSPSLSAQLVAHEPMLYKVARKLCGRPDDARDLVQDTMERALRAGASPNPNTKAWLLSILQHRFIDLWRKRSYSHAPDALEMMPSETVTMAHEASDEPRWAGIDEARVRAAVEKLHPSYREVFILHALEGHAYVDVAKRMGIPKATVGTRLFRARQRLKMLLESELRRNETAGDLALVQRRLRSLPRVTAA